MNMFRVKPRATLGLIFFTVLIHNSDKQWKVLSDCLEKVALRNSLRSSDFPSGLRPSGKSDDPREFPRATFSRQPLRTFRYFSDLRRDPVNWTSFRSCNEFVRSGPCRGLVNANLSTYYCVYLEKHHGS